MVDCGNEQGASGRQNLAALEILFSTQAGSLFFDR
jgi:hypothetical protein